jgi:hypothetical protein
MLDKVLKEIKTANDLIRKAVVNYEKIEQSELNTLKKINFKNPEESPIQYHQLKVKWGQMFYQLLCPINGTKAENRRFSDGSWKHKGNDSPKGPVVFDRIGEMPKYGSRIHWTDSHNLFDRIKEEHIELIENGRGRTDHEKIAKEFWDVRTLIQEKMTTEDDKETTVKLSKSSNVTLVFYKEKSDKKLPVVTLSVKVDSVGVNGTTVKIPWKPSQIEIDRLKDKYNIDLSSSYYNNTNGVKYKLDELSHAANVPYGQAGWSNNYTILGASPILNNPEITYQFKNAFKFKQEARDELNKLDDDYSARIIAKGFF